MKQDLEAQASLIAALQLSYCVLVDQLVQQGHLRSESLQLALEQLSLQYRSQNMDSIADQLEAQVYQLMSFEALRQK